MAYYDGLAQTSLPFMPSGTLWSSNYASVIYMSIEVTLESIKMTMKAGHLTDAFVLMRKLFDTMLVDIFYDVMRKSNYDFENGGIVEEVDNWITGKQRIPRTEKLLEFLRIASSSKDIYPFFGWDTDLKVYREILDDNVHSTGYNNLLLNCKGLPLVRRVDYLDDAATMLVQIATVHIAFVFFLNGHFMTPHDYEHYLD